MVVVVPRHFMYVLAGTASAGVPSEFEAGCLHAAIGAVRTVGLLVLSSAVCGGCHRPSSTAESTSSPVASSVAAFASACTVSHRGAANAVITITRR